MLVFKKLVPTNIFDLMHLDIFYKDVFIKSFPNANECEDLSTIKKYLLSSLKSVYWDYDVVLAFDDGLVVGGAICDYIRSTNTAFIEFLAVRNNYYSKGLGTALFNSVVSVLENNAKAIGHRKPYAIFAEMDDPEHRGSDTMNYMYFNNKVGFKHLQLNYVQPPLIKGKDEVRTLWLLGISDTGSPLFNKDLVIESIHDFFKFAFNMEHVSKNKYFKEIVEQVRNVSTITSVPIIQED